MKILRILTLALIPLALAAIPAPAGTDPQGCGLPAIKDPGIRASFSAKVTLMNIRRLCSSPRHR